MDNTNAFNFGGTAPASPNPASTPTPSPTLTSTPTPMPTMQLQAPVAPTPQPGFQPMPQPLAPTQPSDPLATPPKKTKTKFILLAVIAAVSVIIVVVVLAFLIPALTASNIFLDKANQLIEKIAAQDDEKLVYFAKDLNAVDAELATSPSGASYKAESYATRYGGKVEICLTDGAHTISNIDGELKVADYGDCNYSFTADQKKEYLANYYAKKFETEVKADDIATKDSKFIIPAGDIEIYAKIDIKDNQVNIDDDSELLALAIDDTESITRLIEAYIKSYFGVNDVYDANFRLTYVDNVIILESLYTKTKATEFLEEIGQYILGKGLTDTETIPSITRYRYDDSGMIDSIDYLVGLIIREGEVTTKVASETENAELEE